MTIAIPASRSPVRTHLLTQQGASLAVSVCLALAGSAAAQCAQWSALSSGVDNSTLALAAAQNGDLFAGGAFANAGGVPAARIARWNGTTWSPLGAGVDNLVRSITTLANGDVVVAGDFATAGGSPASRIARWDGSSWQALGAGVSSANLYGLYAVASLPNGDVVAGGYFTQAGGQPANAIARWDGNAWSPLGSGILATVFSITVLPTGDLIVGGNFSTAGGISASRIARWNGSAWSALGSGMTGFRVNAVAALPNGDLVAGGSFTAAGGVAASNVALWNGNAWTALGSGTNGDVLALVAMPNGDILAGGQFTTAGGVAAAGMARWNGSSWSSLAFGSGSQVYALTTAANGARIAGGFFGNAGGVSAGRVASYTSSCPAGASVSGAGCPSSGGNNVYAPQAQPWIGTTYRARATGLPAVSLAVALTGFTTNDVVLASVLQPAPAGCRLQVTPDAIAWMVPTAGVVETSIAIPDTVSIVGLMLHQQLLVLELDAVTSALIEGTVSDRISVTIGAF